MGEKLRFERHPGPLGAELLEQGRGAVQKGHIFVILANQSSGSRRMTEAGIYNLLFFWIPAFAGMTTKRLFFDFLDSPDESCGGMTVGFFAHTGSRPE
ncbi:MAG: hypothetical protein ACE5HO_17835 [bacterium]